MAAICPKMLPLAAVFVGLHICHRVSSLPKPHRVGYVTTSTLLLASSPATNSTAGYCRRCAPRIISHRCNFFLAFLPQWCFSISQQVCGDDHLSPDLVRWLRAVSSFCCHRPVS